MKKIFSFLANLLTSIRNILYNNQLISIKSINLPVISVGNVELGGTGKTPVVLYLCQLLKKNNYKPGIISRGYKRKSKGMQIVSDGIKILLNHTAAGDEPFMLANSLNNIPIIVSKNRYKASLFLKNNFDINVIVLDDAFQHRKINRTIDIVLLNANTPSNKLKMFPLGYLRENFNNLYRADILLITKQNKFTKQKNINFYQNLYFHNKFFTTSNFFLFNPISNKKIIKTSIKNALVFCGIGDANYFKTSILSLNINVAFFKAFDDHQKYNNFVLIDLENLILNNNFNTIITTEKDFVKLPLDFCKKHSIIVLKMSFSLNKNFDELILKLL